MEFVEGLGFVNLPLKRFYKYILKRLIGGFLRHDIDLEQLDVQLYRGIVELKSLELDVVQLNLAALGADLLLHFVSGIVGCIKMDIPWRHLLRDHCKVYVSGLEVVLAKGGLPEVPGPGSAWPSGPSASPAAHELLQAQGDPQAERSDRYSEEGIETLSRLVKHVMSRMELCVQDSSLSVLVPAVRRSLRMRVASIVAFSEEMADGVEERAVRVTGISLSLSARQVCPPEAAQASSASAADQTTEAAHASSASAADQATVDCEGDEGDEGGDMLLASTCAPPSTAPEGMARVRRRGQRLGVVGVLGRGVHLDVELSLHAVRFVVAPAPMRALAECLAALGMQRADSPLDDDETAAYREASCAAATAAGEDADLGDEEDAEEDSAAGPVVGCTLRLSVAHIAGLVVLTDGVGSLCVTPQPADVLLLPGPVRELPSDQAQLCIAGWAVTFERRAAGSGMGPGSADGSESAGGTGSAGRSGSTARAPPTLTLLARSVAMHLHKYGGSGSRSDEAVVLDEPQPQKVTRNLQEVRRAATAAPTAKHGARRRLAPEEFVIHSQREGQSAADGGAATSSQAPPAVSPHHDFSDLDAMFCSARSFAMGESVFEPPPRGSQTPEVASCRCSTTESLGEPDSPLHSAASSVHSLDGGSRAREPERVEPEAALARSPRPADPDRQPAPGAPEERWERHPEQRTVQEEQAKEEEEQEEEEENLEALFFDRSLPIRDVLLRQRHSAGGDGEAIGSSASVSWHGWLQDVPEFQSKQILHLLTLLDPEGSPWHGNATGSTAELRPEPEPSLTLPPVGHPVWNGLHLVPGGEAASQLVGHQFYAEWGRWPANSTHRTQPAAIVELQPIMLSLCADSIHTLASGTAWLSNVVAASSPPRLVKMPSIAYRYGGARRRSRTTFGFVGVAPLVRVELALAATQQGEGCLVSDFVIPRLFGQPQRDPLACRDDCEEALQLDLSDIRVFFKQSAVVSEAGAAEGSTGEGAPSSCLQLLSIRHEAQDSQPTGDEDRCAARVSCSLFRPGSGGALCGGVQQELPAPSPESPAELHQEPAQAEAPQSGWSEWTKISVSQPAGEGRPSRSSLVLQDLRHASQRILRPGQGMRSHHSRSSASLPPSARARARGERGACFRPERTEEALDASAPEAAKSSKAVGPAGRSHQPKEHRHLRASSVDAGLALQEAEGDSAPRCEARVDLDLHVPGVLHVETDALNLVLLQEALVAFGGHLEELEAERPANSRVLAEPDTAAGEAPMSLACTLLLGRLCFRLLEQEPLAGESPGTGGMAESVEELRGTLQFQVAPVSCRLLQSSASHFKVYCAGQDFQLEDHHEAPSGISKQLVQPWFRPLLQPETPETFSHTSFAAAYPWEPCRMRGHRIAFEPSLADIQQGSWRNTHSILLQIDRWREEGTDRANVSLQANRLALSACPHAYRAYSRLFFFFDSNNTGVSFPARAVHSVVSAYQVSAIDCLLDFTSAAYERACLATVRDGQDFVHCLSPLGSEGEAWRAVVHTDHLELRALACEVQSFEANLGECNVLLVDQPGHLLHTDLSSTFPRPVPHLVGLGFSHLLGLSGTSATWRYEGAAVPAKDAEAATGTQPGARRSLSCELKMTELAGHICADTVKCLLCIGADLAELLPELMPAQGTDGMQPPELEFAAMPRAVPEVLPKELPEVRAELPAPDAAAGAGILEGIDMFAFGPEATPPGRGAPCPRDIVVPALEGRGATTPSDVTAPALEGCLVDDYIRAQEQRQSPRAPVRASPSDETQEAEELGPSASSVAVCLFDPNAYAEGELRELCAEDQSARLEAERAIKDDTPDRRPVPSSSGPSTLAGRAAGVSKLPEVFHQDGSAAVWFVDPDEVQVVPDHFVQWSEKQDNQGPARPTQVPSAQVMLTLHFRTVKLSLYGGTDFEVDARARAQELTSSYDTVVGSLDRRRQAMHLTLQLQHSIARLMILDPPLSAPGGCSEASQHKASVSQRRFIFCARDVSVLDCVQSSVFSHVLSYFEDERRRPRPSHVDMIHLVIEEVGTSARRQGAGAITNELFAGSGGGRAGAPQFRVELQLLPLRLTIDQDVVDFLLDFVQLCALPTYVEEEDSRDAAAACPPDEASTMPAESFAAASPSQAAASTTARVPFFQRVTIGPLLLSVDYRAKRLDMDSLRRGELWELINLLPLLEGLQIAFRSVSIDRVSGVSQVVAQVVSSWSADLNRTQILRSLTGVTPIRSFANIGGGFAEMVLEPLKQYRAGGGTKRISRTILRGLVSFLKHVTVESIDLTERIFVGTQSALEYMDVCLREQPRGTTTGRAPGYADAAEGSIAQNWTAVERGTSDFLQPGGAAEGLQQACTNLTRGVRQASEAMLVRPLLEFHRGAPRNQVLRSVVSGIPMCILQPAIGATAAATTALRGVRNSVDPLHRREIVQKYKGPQ